MRLPNFTAHLLTLLLAALPAPAAALYFTDVSSTFAIGGAGVVAGPAVPSSSTGGTGVASFTGLVSPSGALPASKMIGVGGSAASPPASFATSTYLSGHLISFDNTAGLVPLLAAFTFSYSWTIVVSADFPGAEFATAGAFFHITGIDNETLTIGGLVAPEFLVHPMFSTALGETAGVGGAVVAGSILVPAGEFAVFSVITDTSGLAVSAPEPATFGLALLAALVAGTRRFRGSATAKD